MDIKLLKQIEREKFKLIRKDISISEKERVMNNVESFISSVYRFKEKAKYIAIYWPLKNEIDITSLKKKYPLALPKCKSNKNLEFYAWDDSPLENDFEGIPSPINKKLRFDEISLILVPCLAMDRNLIRLGYGGGYYDKLRSDKNWRSIKILGILTSSCICNVPLSKAKWDIALSGFITDKEIYV